MQAMFSILRKDLLQIVRDRSSLILMLLVPLILVATVGFALGNVYGSSQNTITIQVAVSDQDHGLVGQAVLKALDQHSSQLTIKLTRYSDAAGVQQAVSQGQGSVTGVVIPAGTTARLQQAAARGEPTQNLVQIYTIPSSNDPSSAVVQNLVTSTVGQLATATFAGSAAIQEVERICQQPGNHCEPGSIDPQTIASRVGAASLKVVPPAQVASLHAGNVPTQVNVFDVTLPGYAILFALFGLQAVAGSILEERESGTLRRLLVAPVQRYALLGGKLLTQFLVTMLQLLMLFAIGSFLFKLHVSNWLGVIILLVVTSFAMTGFGILLVSLVRTRRQLPMVLTIVTLTTSAIGGAWWPLWLEPQWLQMVAHVGIVAWAMEALNGLMVSGRTLAEVLPNVVALIIYGLLCFILGLALFRFQPRTVNA
ncbi:MAG: ABC transporter permease [Thermogemmatispora sp.]|uniref:ABC transporter permease n=1 Tax=Thermogemmatispora sp. TaxID=1968838 RepID=UPI00260FEC0A|nr:ABC transporter permease [Thermogemmatispora sp.]MBX5456102.1 ABC transporter permease [Thermogemmatispora sp.]